MTTCEIRIYGDPVLRQKAAPVTAFDDQLKISVEKMFATMFAADGIGLAATQVNILQAFLVIGMPADEKDQEPVRFFFANPEIIETQGDAAYDEGCLSVPGLKAEVIRPDWIRVKFQDIEGNPQELETDGLLARVLQHEIDHLNGILFIDRISTARRFLMKKELEKLADSARGDSKRTSHDPSDL
jgi:peptide deformylase